MKHKSFLICGLLCGLVALSTAQETETDRMQTTAAMTGQEMFHAYCAVCHGDDARGAGPAAIALKIPPSDLTQLSKKSGGQFPIIHVQQTILGDVDIPSHGTKEMPIYGDIFRTIHRDEMFVRQRLGLLVNYLASLQQK